MPGFFVHQNAAIQCTHTIPTKIVPTQPRVRVSTQLVATMTAQMTVAGCPFTVPGPKPQPCALVKWGMQSARVKVMAQPVMLAGPPGPGPGVCQSPEQIPNGPPIVVAVQPRVSAM